MVRHVVRYILPLDKHSGAAFTKDNQVRGQEPFN